MATVAQFLVSELAAVNRTPNDVQTVSRFVPELGIWLEIGRAEFIAAAQRVQHPIVNSAWYMFRSRVLNDEEVVMLYDGGGTTILDLEGVYDLTANQLSGIDPFPG